MSKHTPGPWEIEHAEDIDLPNHVGISADKHSLLAQVVWKMEDDERSPHCEANARLIAAAPDLLDALKTAKWMLERDYIDDQKMRVIEKCDAAIAKATGETT